MDDPQQTECSRRAASHLTTLGLQFASEKREDEAMDAFRRAVSAEPNAADAWFYLGILYCDRDMIAESIAAYRQAAVEHPENSLYWYVLGTMYQTFQPRRWRRDATTAFRQALRQEEDYPEARLALDGVRDACVLGRTLRLAGRVFPSLRT